MGMGFEVDSAERVDELYREIVEAGFRGQTEPWDAFGVSDTLRFSIRTETRSISSRTCNFY